jgi:hypothetical protein
VEHVEGDILTIFDACYASNLHGTEILSPDPRMFEMLMATGFDKMIAPPGRRSFTAALVHSLRALLKQYGENPFTTISHHIDGKVLVTFGAVSHVTTNTSPSGH